MLLMKPNCQCCDQDLATTAPAMICSLECTFCADCGMDRFGGRCPNCGGELVLRPKRPRALLDRYPAQAERELRAHEGCIGGTFA